MYENMTYEFLLERALNRVPNTIDKREGSIVFDAVAPCCAELASVYIELDRLLKESHADTASYEYMKLIAKDRGIIAHDATSAILELQTTPVDVNVAIGERFSIETLNYVVIEKISDGVYKVKCETLGTEGNQYFGTCIPVNYIEGLETCTITELLIPAEDVEDVESLRERHRASFTDIAFGGNRADYTAKIKSIDGVGGVKLYRTPNGGGTVGATIIDSEYGQPSDELITLVQNTIDPEVNQGEGLGLAPFGHTVTITGVVTQSVDIDFTLTYEGDWNWDELKQQVFDVIDAYFLELSVDWEDNANLVVRISQLESRILSVGGVIDISGTRLNGVASNLTLEPDKIPIRGVVNG